MLDNLSLVICHFVLPCKEHVLQWIIIIQRVMYFQLQLGYISTLCSQYDTVVVVPFGELSLSGSTANFHDITF